MLFSVSSKLFFSIVFSTPFLALAARLPSSEVLARSPSGKLEDGAEGHWELGRQIERRATTNAFQVVGNSGVSAQMMFLGTADKVYILDKVESNSLQVNGHSAFATEYTLSSDGVRGMDVKTNTWCAGGSSLGDGRWISVGGNLGVAGYDGDGGVGVRFLTPCDGGDCEWDDNPANYISTRRWYVTVEPMDDGGVIIIGGSTYGGYVNDATRNNPTYEFYPSRGGIKTLNLLVNTLPANYYPLTWLLPSGRLFIQANLETAILDPSSGTETRIADVPAAVRTNPAGGAAVLLPLTPANGYTATILMCGGQDISDWTPSAALVNHPASDSCVRITPDGGGSWSQDATLPEGRTLGSFVLLPDGKIWLGNGAGTGTAGYGSGSYLIGSSFAKNPIQTPVIYDPATRSFNRAGLGTSDVPRLYHSSAILLPDGSVFIAGSNPNNDVQTRLYPTEYRTEKFFPWYYNLVRPEPIGTIPGQLSYGGNYFTIQLNGSSLQGLTPSVAATSSRVIIIRTGFSTHGLNMGQRYLELNSTATPTSNDSISLFISQVPPNPALFAPGSAFLHVVVNGVPSIGRQVMIGNGIGSQPTLPVQRLPGP
ncbi:glyoxal oxidase N-terminus-domain-containing protein [Cantharellus anzutake]|uniref:glyoxal oxidase N-terminus-domain-containing protein n=1 Tax=Cantharellus anzutake TaxID=1750568 RepID=UPI0019059BB7|nr:glyoxal oxidase N-terminus-domain-containing protein [Cantharellus anzutake]KAF8334887.1 glyoxal oxidase N-terminus-domain-containing protein [Cantharellus anzutake]